MVKFLPNLCASMILAFFLTPFAVKNAEASTVGDLGWSLSQITESDQGEAAGILSSGSKNFIMGYGWDWFVPAGSFPSEFNPPSEARVCAVSGSAERTGPEISLTRRSSYNRVRLITVEVNSPEAPVALLLTNSLSTLWRIKVTPGTTVTAAAVSGSGFQAVTGLAPEVPVLVNRDEGEDLQAHARIAQNIPGQHHLPRFLIDFSKKYFGREPDIKVATNQGLATCGWASRFGFELISPSEFVPEKYDPYSDLLEKLDQALELGLIRRAKPADLNKFTQARSMGGRLIIEENGPQMMRDAYVVESSFFVFPVELDRLGDPSARVFTFYIPPELKLPQGPLEGVRVLFMADGACLGRNCGGRGGLYSAFDPMPVSRINMQANCRFEGFKLPRDARIFAGGSCTLRKGQSGRPEPERIKVTVNSPDAPAVLILGGTNPAEWHFDLAPGTELAAVLLSGRSPGTQKIVNLPPGVPALNYSGLSCVYFSFLPGDFDKINSVSQTLFGRLPERGFQAVDGKLIIDPSLPIRAAAPVDLKPAPKIRPNQDLELALAEGLIRPASAELRAAWYKKHAEKAGWANLMDPADYNYEPSFPVYEILSESFAFSANMVNSDQLGFILPENMSLPEGAPGRSIIHIMDDGACWGSGRGCQSYSN